MAAPQFPGMRSLEENFLRANPHLRDTATFERQRHQPSKFECEATRVVPAGGALSGLLLHDSMVPFQFIFRVLPNPAIFTATRSQPVQVTIGAFTVPQQMALALAEYRFRPYRFDGIIPGDAVPLEDRRLSLEVGNSVPISNFTQRGNLSAQIIPAVPPVQSPTFQGMPTGGTVGDGTTPSGTPTMFPGTIPDPYAVGGLSTVNSSIAPPLNLPFTNTRQFVISAQGASLIPQSNDASQGPERLPFTYYVPENTPVSLDMTVFGPVRIPVNFFEGVLRGYSMPQNALRALLDKVRPCEGQ